MKIICFIFGLLLTMIFTSTPVFAQIEIDSSVRLTYIANEGFLIQSENHKILIDGIFSDKSINYCQIPPDSVLRKIEHALPPFNNIDLIFITHMHRDHFDAKSVVMHLQNNPDGILICPPQVVEKIREESDNYPSVHHQIKEVLPEADGKIDFIANEVPVTALGLKHSPKIEFDVETAKTYDKHGNIQNLGYMIDLDGEKIIHVGDAIIGKHEELFQKIIPQNENLRYIFLEFFDTSPQTEELLKNYIKPENIIFMHLPLERNKVMGIEASLKELFSAALLFTEPMETYP